MQKNWKETKWHGTFRELLRKLRPGSNQTKPWTRERIQEWRSEDHRRRQRKLPPRRKRSNLPVSAKREHASKERSVPVAQRVIPSEVAGHKITETTNKYESIGAAEWLDGQAEVGRTGNRRGSKCSEPTATVCMAILQAARTTAERQQTPTKKT